MKIAAWNLNHRTNPKPVPDGVEKVVRHLAPDVLVLTEYVDSKASAAFRDSLAGMRLSHVSVTAKRDVHNQVLVATRFCHEVGRLRSPVDSHAQANFLSISFLETDETIVGLRVPAYKTAVDVKAYWTELTDILEGAAEDKVVLIGDLNCDPDDGRSIGGVYVKALLNKGWQVPSPPGDWSYISRDGMRRSRIDHALASPTMRIESVSYVKEVNGMVVAGSKDQNALSDHAIVVCKLDGT